ncbi:MAG TPA: Gfo/Idh/MocA family oxidoreductase [Kiritimatiellia bacterium]
MSDSKKVKIISIGGGWVVNNRHLLALKQSGHFDVIGVISNDPKRAESTAGKHGVPHCATELTFQGWQSEAEAVMIGTVPHVHHTLAKRALESGRHVLTEKPMTVDIRDAMDLDRIAKDKKRVLAVVHNFQFSRAAHAFRRDLAAGRIGDITSIYGVQLCNHKRNIPAWCDQLPLGLFYDEAPHFYYLFRSLAGGDLTFMGASVWKPHKSPPGGDKPQNTPRMVSGEYRAPAGYPVFLHINFESSLTEWHVTVVGEKATADIDVWRDIYVRLPNDGVHSAKDILWTSLTGTGQHFAGVLTGGLRYVTGRHLYGNDEVVARFYRAIQGEDSLQGMNPAEGLRVITMQHELIEKARYYD